jgi:hypothetical protein
MCDQEKPSGTESLGIQGFFTQGGFCCLWTRVMAITAAQISELHVFRVFFGFIYMAGHRSGAI